MEETRGRKKSQEAERAAPHTWRVWWTVRTPLGLWEYNQRVEYAETKDRAVNAALAKIRRDYPGACVTRCDEITSPVFPAGPPE